MVWLPEKIKQRWHKIDVTDWLWDTRGACLSRKPNQQRNACGFFELCFFYEKMMRAQAVAVIACVHNDRVITQAQSFQATKNGAYTSVHQGNQTKIPLLNTAVFLKADAKK